MVPIWRTEASISIWIAPSELRRYLHVSLPIGCVRLGYMSDALTKGRRMKRALASLCVCTLLSRSLDIRI